MVSVVASAAVLLALLALQVARPLLQEQGDATTAQAQGADQGAAAQLEARRQALVDHGSEQPARVGAAIDLLGSDPAFLAARLGAPAGPEVLSAILDALAIRGPSEPRSAEMVTEVLALIPGVGGEIGGKALRTLRILDAAYPEQTRPRLVAALRGEDAALAEAAIRVLALTRDLKAVPPLLDLLAQTGGAGPLAEAAAAALAGILGTSFGADAAKWNVFWQGCAGKTREQILEEVLAAERVNHAGVVERKDREIIRLKREIDVGDRDALLADLQHELRDVRRFAAEALARGSEDWDVSGARPVILGRLESGSEPSDVIVAFLKLLCAIDAQAEASGPDVRRDALIVSFFSSPSPEVVVAAVEAAEQFPVDQVRTAILDAVRELSRRPLTPAARSILVKACGGKLNLREARDQLVALLSNDESGDVRLAAVGALGSFRMPDTAEYLARALREDSDWRVRRKAASELAAVAGTAAVEHLLRGLEDPRIEVRAEVAAALSGLDGEQAAVALVARLEKEKEVTVRTAIVRALGSLGFPQALDALCAVALARDAAAANGPGVDPAVLALQLAAQKALQQVAGDDPARWGTVVARFAGSGRRDLEQFALAEQLRTLVAARAPLETILEARLALAGAAFAAGDFDAVERVAAEGLAEAEGVSGFGPRSELAALRGRALREKGEHGAAAASLEQAITLGGLVGAGREEIVTLAAAEHRAAGNLERAIAILGAEEVLSGEQLLLLASCLKEAQSGREAAACLRDYLARFPGENAAAEFGARLDLAELLLEQGDAVGAERVLQAGAAVPAGASAGARERLRALRQRIAEAAKAAPRPEGGQAGAGGGSPGGTGDDG
ncbi:MAG: HEAT repeat domain-containing protein [Planctomycetes bacterium]|nr:HEAT repeat domain-containing protein [Planctomycetota bacterium]